MKLSRPFINPAADFFSDFDQFFNRAFGASALPDPSRAPDGVAVYEAEDAWHFRTDLPGFTREDLDLRIESGVLSLKAGAEDREGSFRPAVSRRLRLPKNADPARVEAKLENGVLEVVVPKVAPHEPETRRIEIK